MSHMVIYRGSDGKPGYHQVDDIHEAVSFVEEMRNNDGVDHARIFRLEEVTFEYKPYYRVEIGNGAAAVTAAEDSDVDTDDSVVSIESADESENSEDASDGDAETDEVEADSAEDHSDEDSGAGARRGLFGR